jgi:hypothetical protein
MGKVHLWFRSKTAQYEPLAAGECRLSWLDLHRLRENWLCENYLCAKIAYAQIAYARISWQVKHEKRG